MVIEEASNVTLEKLPFESDYKEQYATFEYHLDHKVTESDITVSYNTATKKTTFTFALQIKSKYECGWQIYSPKTKPVHLST